MISIKSKENYTLSTFYNLDFLFKNSIDALLKPPVSISLFNAIASSLRACSSFSNSKLRNSFLLTIIEFLGNFEKLSIRGQRSVFNSIDVNTPEINLNFKASCAVNLWFSRSISEAFDVPIIFGKV